MKSLHKTFLNIASYFSKSAGFNNFCPICQKMSRNFLPSGVKKRERALCPYCKSLERHRLIYLLLSNNTDVFVKKTKLLHFAPENCLRNIFKIKGNINYVTADLYMKEVDFNIDIINTKFPNNSFDFILCIHVLEHIEDDIRAMMEIHRILRKGGKAIIMVPILREKTLEDASIISPKDRLKYFGQEDHVRIYGLDFIDRLENVGFRVKRVNYINKLGKTLSKFYSVITGNQETEDIYLCLK